jgi:[ribosomal protein S5]-alanine N-acetyltransferase
MRRQAGTELEVGPRVFLRRPTLRDEKAFIELVEKSRRLHRPWVTPPADSSSYRRYVGRNRREDFEGLLVCRLEDGAIAGLYELGQISRGDFQSAYVGYYANAAYQRQGYMTEGMELVIRYAFRTLKLHRLEANIQPGNKASVALVERCGFSKEGFSPRYLKIGGRWRDHERWAITVEAWRAARKQR